MAKEKTLFLVESPNKCQTIKGILTKLGYNNATVMATVGHFCEIKDDRKSYHNTGIYPDQDFKINFIITPDKKENVSKLKEQVKAASKIYIASDNDREGEAIAWECKEFLKIPESKYERITTHEITMTGLKNALANPRKIDEALVDAAHSRSVLDKMVGYRLSGIARKNVQARSVGRCQSAGLKIIVMREEEIQKFKPEEYDEVYLTFTKGNTDFKAKYVGTDSKPIKAFKTKPEADKVVEECKGNDFIVKTIDKREKYQSTKIPFNTSSFQQEVASKLGYSVKQAMSSAQKLFEGISIAGEHVSLITYHRTDSVDVSPEFATTLEAYVKKTFGEKYYQPLKKVKKKDNEQAGHECLRVTNPELTPDELSKYVDDAGLLAVYKIIWKRTIASMMKDATISETTYNIYNKDNKFVLISNEIIFEGFLKIYNYSDDKEEEPIKETFEKDEKLQNTNVFVEQKMTKPPKRYTEATFQKELEKQGIGRPSTYASIIETLKDPKRNYCIIEEKKFVPTELGMKLSHFLDQSFPNFISIEYTSEMEKDLDLIANGKMKKLEFLKSFHKTLEESVKKVIPVEQEVPKVNDVCPECGKPLVYRKGRYGPFLGCSGYPKCHYIKKISK